MTQAAKSLDAASGRVGGYLIVWGSPAQRDLTGEYFTPETDIALDWFPQRPMLYQHGLDGTIRAAVIGTIDTLRVDEVGVWAEGQLDLRKRYVQAVQQLVEQGVLSWSSGSLAHLVEVTPDGRIKRWPVVEGSLTPAPAEPRRTDVRTVKSAYAALGLPADRLRNDSNQTQGETTMTEYQADYQDEGQPRRRLPLHDSAEAVKAHISVGSPYDTLDALDMLHGYMLLRAGKHFTGVSERYGSALVHKLTRSGGLLNAVKASGDLSATVVTGYGDDWVPELWSSQIWQKARQDNVILPLFRSVEMASNPFELPIEGADPTVHYVPETKDEAHLTLGEGNPLPDSKIGSGKVQLNARKLALRVGFSAELVEDAIVPVLNIYREQAMRAIADSIDHVLLNGDADTTTANINAHDAAPGATDRVLAFDGLRKLPLVTNTANRTALSEALTLADLRAVRFLMPARYAARPGDLAWIVDSTTYSKLLGLSEFLTMDKAGALATAQTGQIGYIDGIPVVVSAEMPLTSSDGTTGATNNRGTALCVYRPGWFVGYRRRIAVDVTYLPYYDSYQLTATVRLGFGRFDTEVASALYNI
ncbi:MAG: phage major capsid protein [Phototrophicaceae bacterium]